MSEPPKVGEPFNAYKRLNNYLIPTSVATLTNLSWFAKLLYGVLRFLAGNSDHCEVKLQELAARFRVSDETVQRAIESLAREKLMKRKRGSSRSVITFLWSEQLKGSIPKQAESASERSPQTSGVRNGAAASPQNRGGDSAGERSAYKESGLKGNPKEKRKGAESAPKEKPSLALALALSPPPRKVPGLTSLREPQATWWAEVYLDLMWPRKGKTGEMFRAAEQFARHVATTRTRWLAFRADMIAEAEYQLTQPEEDRLPLRSWISTMNKRLEDWPKSD